MFPDFKVNLAAIAVASICSFSFGAVWYGPLFGKLWRKLMKIPSNFKPDRNVAILGLVLNFLGTLLMAYVMSHEIGVWRPSSWKLPIPDQPAFSYAFFAAFFAWLGYFIPMGFNTIAFEGKSWKLFGLNAIYHFVNLLVIAMVLAHWQ